MGRWLDEGERSNSDPGRSSKKNLEFREFKVELPRVSAKSLRRVVFHRPLATVNRLLFTHAGSRVSPAFHFVSFVPDRSCAGRLRPPRLILVADGEFG